MTEKRVRSAIRQTEKEARKASGLAWPGDTDLGAMGRDVVEPVAERIRSMNDAWTPASADKDAFVNAILRKNLFIALSQAPAAGDGEFAVFLRPDPVDMFKRSNNIPELVLGSIAYSRRFFQRLDDEAVTQLMRRYKKARIRNSKKLFRWALPRSRQPLMVDVF